MSWKFRPTSRSLLVNGPLLAFHRERNQLTQAAAAGKAGYSVRLIRKAEAGGALHPDTIEILAETYSSPGFTVFPEDLIANPQGLTAQLLEAYQRDGRQITHRIQSILDPEIEFHYAGDPEEIPFAGTHLGIEGFDRFWSMFFDTWEPDNHKIFRPKIVADGNDVYSFAVDQCTVPGLSVPVSTFLVKHFQFRRGLIHKLSVMVDTQAIAAYLRLSRNLSQDTQSRQRRPQGSAHVARS